MIFITPLAYVVKKHTKGSHKLCLKSHGLHIFLFQSSILLYKHNVQLHVLIDLNCIILNVEYRYQLVNNNKK